MLMLQFCTLHPADDAFVMDGLRVLPHCLELVYTWTAQKCRTCHYGPVHRACGRFPVEQGVKRAQILKNILSERNC